jgi:hypothetical protein
MLMVGIANASSTAVSTVTWNGAALTLVPSCSATGSALNSAHFEIWSLANPANVSANVTITFGSSQTAYAGAAAFTGVASVGACLKGSGGTGSTSNSQTPPVLAGEAAFDTMSVNTIGSATITVGSSQVTVDNSSSGSSAGASSYKLDPVGSLSDSWNTSTSVWAHGVVPLNPAATGRKGQTIIGALRPEPGRELVAAGLDRGHDRWLRAPGAWGRRSWPD